MLSIAAIEAQALDIAALVATKPKANTNPLAARGGWAARRSRTAGDRGVVWLEERGVAALDQAIAERQPRTAGGRGVGARW